MESECRKRKNPLKCIKYYRTLVEKGKDVAKIFGNQKLESVQKKNQNGKLSKRLDLLEKKTESELRWIFIHMHACTPAHLHTCTPAHFNFWLYSHCLPKICFVRIGELITLLWNNIWVSWSREVSPKNWARLSEIAATTVNIDM